MNDMTQIHSVNTTKNSLPIKSFEHCALWVFSSLKIPSFSLSLVFCGDRRMKRLNRLYRNKDKTTDVLSFLYDKGEGEIVISIPQAKRQAKEHEVDVKVEVYDLIIHGILHLLGYDHELEKQAKIMFDLQDKLLHQYVDID